ncbi:MFS transporter [Haloechinothrix halophila]|uniref:MFS transporter n=1 Tax=Haloechinothrix halophila TaxID=1069073 RepID=UPI00068818AE|nr:MFS transporter [Haloechinothrix halophila]
MADDGFASGSTQIAPRPGRALGTNYWRLWVSSGLSNLADGIIKIALPLVAIQFTRSPTLIAGLTAAVTLPWLFFALPAGALADRLDRRRAMLGANGVRALLIAVLGLVALVDVGSIWVLYAAALGLGIAETMYDTSAQSILPQVVRPDLLPRANGRLYAAELTANDFVGPPLAGFLVATGVAIALSAPAALWGVAVVALVFVRGSFRIERSQRTTMRTDIAEGLRFLGRHQLLRTFAVMTGLFNLATSATLAVFVLYAVGESSAMRLSEQAFGMLLATIAGGSLFGSFVAEWIGRVLGRARALAFSILCGAMLVGIPAATANPFVIGAGFFIGGIGIVAWNVIVVSLRQRITPNRLLGRVNSGYRLVAWGTRPLGALAGGLLAQLFGLQTTFAITALVVLTMLGGMAIATDGRIDAAEREAA